MTNNLNLWTPRSSHGAWHPVGHQHLTAERLVLPELTHSQVTLQGSACCPGREPVADLEKTSNVESGSVPAILPSSSSHYQYTAFSNVYRKLLSSPSTCPQLATQHVRVEHPLYARHQSTMNLYWLYWLGKEAGVSYWSLGIIYSCSLLVNWKNNVIHIALIIFS